jgi:hypothetical protein
MIAGLRNRIEDWIVKKQTLQHCAARFEKDYYLFNYHFCIKNLLISVEVYQINTALKLIYLK